MIFRTCEYCGAHLDPGEPCDCRKEEAAERLRCNTGAALHTDKPHNIKKEEITDVIREKH